MPTPVQRLAAGLRAHWPLTVWITALSLWRAATGDHTESMWMSREGADVLAGGGFTHADRWSWTPQQWDFVPTSPGWELLSAAGASVIGALAFPLLAFLVTASTLAVQARLARHLGASTLATIAALGLSATFAAGILTSRAAAPAFMLLMVELLVFWRLRTRILGASVTRRLLGSGVLAFTFAYVGIWLHNSWTMFAVMASVGIALILRDDADARWRTAALSAAAASMLATVVGPLGINAWTNAARVSAECRGLVREWTTPWALGDVWPWLWVAVAVIVTLGCLHELRRPRAALRRPLTVIQLAIAVGAVVAGAVAIRFLLLGIVAATPLLAHWLTLLTRSARAMRLRRALGERGSSRYWTTIAAMLGIVALALSFVVVAGTPVRESAAIAALPRNCNLFSDDFDAKRVEYWRPDIRVWVDGRQDYWGRERLLEANRYQAGAVAGRLVPAGTTCVVLSTSDTRATGVAHALAHALDRNPDWQRLVTTPELTAWSTR